MSSRDKRLAETKYAGRTSASEKAAEKAARRSATPSPVAEDPMEQMRQAIEAPRTPESLSRASAHKRGLPRLG